MNERLCPHCHSEQIIEGRLEGGSFFPTELRAEPTAFVPMRVPYRATMCVECGLLWLRVDVQAALRLVQQVGNPELQRRVKGWQKQGGHTLLRPASAPTATSGEILLRPAASATTPAEQLLRSTDHENS